jgi:hypothetical protein
MPFLDDANSVAVGECHKRAEETLETYQSEKNEFIY